MSLTKLSQRDHTTAVVSALALTGIPVGRGIRNEEPDGSGGALDPPCMVVHPLAGGRRFGVLDDHVKHADLVYQVTCVGQTQAEAEFVRDQTEILLDGITVDGRVIDVIRVDFGSDNAIPDYDVGAPKTFFSSMPRYRLSSTPA